MKGSVVALSFVLLFASIAAAQDCAEDVTFDVSDGTISIYHREALYNCCAWIDIEVNPDGYEIDVYEWEKFEEGPCYCLCCFDIMVTIGGLAPGEYTVRIWKAFDNFDGTWRIELLGEWIVAVDGTSAPFIATDYIPCVETSAPEDVSTWGTIKALYR
jgi:hypothetical protein